MSNVLTQIKLIWVNAKYCVCGVRKILLMVVLGGFLSRKSFGMLSVNWFGSVMLSEVQ